MIMGPPNSLYDVTMSWSRTLREEYRLRVFENRVLWKIFGPRRDGVTEDWKRLTKKGALRSVLLAKYCSHDQIRRMRYAGHVACMGNSTGEYRVMVRTTEGGRPLRRSRRGWEDYIEMDLTQVEWKGLGYAYSADRFRFRLSESESEPESVCTIGVPLGLIWLRIRRGGGYL